MISFKWQTLVLFPAIALSICHKHGASMHVLLLLTVELHPHTQQQCIQSHVTQTRVKGEKECQTRQSFRH
jgi:hypothetical protein